MPILDNNPTFTYCSWKNMMVTYNKTMYPVQNGHSNKKYLYWESSTPYELIETNVRKPLVADRFLIFINDKGIHTLVPNGDDIVISFDGDNPDLISEKIYGIYEKTEEFDSKFVTVETDINGIKQIVGDSSSQEGTLVDRVSKIEQKSNEIDLSVKEVTKEFNNNREMLELRETINKSIIELNSALGIFSSKMNDYYKDNKVSDEEKIEIETQISILDNEKSKVFLEVDKIIRLMESQDQSDKVNNLTSAKGQLDTAITNLKTVINTAISDNTFVPSEVTLITDNFGKCNTKVNLLKNTIDECIFLGAGGKITEELARIGIKSNEIVLSVSSVEENLKSDASIMKSELEGQIKDVNTALGNFEETVNGAFKDGLIDETEKAILSEKLKVLDKEKTDINVKYESFFNDVNLNEPEKSSMTTAYNEYVAKHEELKNKISHVISDDMVNDAEKLEVDTLFTEYATKLANVNDSMNKAIDKIALNKANSEIKNAKDQLQGQINDVNDKISDLDHVIDGTFENNLIDEAERKSIEQNLNTLKTEKTDIDNQYTTLYNNQFLDGQLKIDYKTSYDDYVSKHDALVNVINGILNKNEFINNTDRQNMTNAYNNLNESLASFITISNRVIDYIATNKSESVKNDLETQISEIDGKVDNIVGDLSGAIKDGIIDETEASILSNNINELNKEKLDVDKRYEYIYNDVDLVGSSKANLLNAKTDFDLKINKLIETINTITSDKSVTEEEKLLFDNAVADYNTSSSNLSGAFDEAINSIAIKKNNDLKSQLSKEISDLNTALGDLETTMNDTFKDGILSEAEKLSIKQNLQTLSNEKADIDKQYETVYANANLVGDAKTNLKTSYDDYILKYNTLVTTINEILEKEGLVDSTDQAKLNNAFKEHSTSLGIYSQRINEAIDSIAKKIADDTANKVDKKYAEILLTPDGIVNKVSKIETTTSEHNSTLTKHESELSMMAGEINQKVSAGDIASSINQTPQAVKINASKINLNGYVTMTNLRNEGETTIHGGNIETGTISVNHLKSNNENPIIKLFDTGNGKGYCSLDATHLYEQGQGKSIRLKWDDENYIKISPTRITNGQKIDAEVSFFSGLYPEHEVFTFRGNQYWGRIITPKGTLEMTESGVAYKNRRLAWYDEVSNVSWGSISGKPSTFPPSSHTHNYANSSHTHYVLEDDYNGRARVAVFGGNGAWVFRQHCSVEMNLGNGANRWGAVYSNTGSIQTSSKKHKKNINYVNNIENKKYYNVSSTPFIDFIKDEFRPATYRLIAKNTDADTSEIYNQIGFIAEDVANTDIGKTFVYNIEEDETKEPDYMYSTSGYVTVVGAALQEEILKREEEIALLKEENQQMKNDIEEIKILLQQLQNK